MLRDIWHYGERSRVSPCTVALLKLSVLLFLRPTEIRSLRWSSYNRAKKWLEVEALKTDNTSDTYNHIVPLSRQSIEILEGLYELTGVSEYIFFSPVGKEPYPSENTANDSLKRLGYRGIQTAHGLRATAATILNEVLGFNRDWINVQLAHVVKDPNGTSYFRGKYLRDRIKMMQTWSDYIDDLLNGTSFVPVVSFEENSDE
ncbi:MAG: site-specific integrase [Gammaproteobacteria bacterium]|nr:site-specific integrase [Gammaproteobacteria bacterium]